MIRVLFCGLKNEYGRPDLGSSFEYQNFFGTLRQMEGVEADFFAIDEIMQEVGRDEMNRLLVRQIEGERYDLLFCFLFTGEIKKETIDHITRKTKTETFNWFADDHWRFPIFSRFWAPLFTAVSTTDSKAIEKYHHIGVKNVIKTQWAANTFLYKPQNNNNYNDNYNITFVGKNYGNRGEYVKSLQNHNLPVEGFGKGWPSGVVDFQKMLEIFSCSKINLNFTDSYLNLPKEIIKLFVRKELDRYRLSIRHPIFNLQSLVGKRRRQIKARVFEVPATGGFLLTQDADNLRDYYIDGKEIVIFKSQDDLVKKCRYYLEYEEERAAIAKAGYERTLKEHTYERRFTEIFKKMELY